MPLCMLHTVNRTNTSRLLALLRLCDFVGKGQYELFHHPKTIRSILESIKMQTLLKATFLLFKTRSF
jgi:hypothetical protein